MCACTSPRRRSSSSNSRWATRAAVLAGGLPETNCCLPKLAGRKSTPGLPAPLCLAWGLPLRTIGSASCLQPGHAGPACPAHLTRLSKSRAQGLPASLISASECRSLSFCGSASEILAYLPAADPALSSVHFADNHLDDSASCQGLLDPALSMRACSTCRAEQEPRGHRCIACRRGWCRIHLLQSSEGHPAGCWLAAVASKPALPWL